MAGQHPPDLAPQRASPREHAREAEAADAAAGASPDSHSPVVRARAARDAGPAGIETLADVDLNVRIELGRAQLPVGDVLALAEGSVVELDRLAGDPVDVFVNDVLVARGEVLVLDGNFCVRVTEIVEAGEEGVRQ